MTTAKPRPPLAPGETRAYPVLPLRDIVVFPHMIAPLFVGRKKSILALEEMMRSDTFILLATQKNASDDEPVTEAIYEIGTLANVLHLLKLPDGTIKVLVEGAQRAKVVKYTDCSEYYEAEAVALGDMSTPEQKCIGLPEQKYISELARRPGPFLRHQAWVGLSAGVSELARRERRLL